MTFQMLRKLLPLPLTLVAIVAISGCERKSPAADKPAPSASPTAAALPANLFLTAEPAGAIGVRSAKLEAAAGQEVAVRGRIGGRKDPFVKGSAVFLLVDKALPTCNDKHGDGCPTPWDYCCEPRDDVVASTATVQVTGEDGRPLKLGLQGQTRLEPGAEVVVAGAVASFDKDGTLVLTARGVYVVPR